MKTRTKVYLGLSVALLAGSGIAIGLLGKRKARPLPEWVEALELLRQRSLEAEVQLPPQHPENLMAQVECEYCAGQGKKTAVSVEGYGDFEYPCKWCDGQGVRTIPVVEGTEDMWRVM